MSGQEKTYALTLTEPELAAVYSLKLFAEAKAEVGGLHGLDKAKVVAATRSAGLKACDATWDSLTRLEGRHFKPDPEPESEATVKIDGKSFSESTIKAALKAHCKWGD